MAKAKRFGLTGTWYFQHTYQMRELARRKLAAANQRQAVREGQEILQQNRDHGYDLDEPCVVFLSDDGSIRYTIPI